MFPRHTPDIYTVVTNTTFVPGRTARCQALAGHTKLQTLRLCENPLGEAGQAPLVLWKTPMCQRMTKIFELRRIAENYPEKKTV